jgi:uncharacterized caspase-like protein
LRGLLLAALLAPVLAQAQPAAAPAPESRVALVIGNAAYPSSPLRNPVNDATAVAERLRALGFDVTLKTNVKQREMTRAVSLFGQSIKPRGVALFYYAGHGLQVRGRNFLVPIDAEIESEASARSESVDLDLVLEQLAPSRLSMVILDACRNNPFENKFRSVGGGLAQVDAPKGTLLAYATAPGKVASDGVGAHGLYTEEILKAIDVPGIKVEDVFKRVRVNVIKATGGEQIPWESSSLTGDYYFKPAAKTGAPDKALHEAKMKQEELQKRLDTERTQREVDAQALKAEMEQLRSEVRKLTQASAPATVEAAKPPVSAPVPAPAPAPVLQKMPPKAPAPEKVAAATTAPAPASTKGTAAIAANGWAYRVSVLETRRGKLTFSSALAILLDPLTDEELTGLLEREKNVKRMFYHSALAVGVAADGKLVWWRAAGQGTPSDAQQVAETRCRPSSAAPCVAIMVNGDFREAEFIEWARGVKVKDVKSMRSGFLRMPS